jgi:hypothetical protein
MKFLWLRNSRWKFDSIRDLSIVTVSELAAFADESVDGIYPTGHRQCSRRNYTEA